MKSVDVREEAAEDWRVRWKQRGCGRRNVDVQENFEWIGQSVMCRGLVLVARNRKTLKPFIVHSLALEALNNHHCHQND